MKNYFIKKRNFKVYFINYIYYLLSVILCNSNKNLYIFLLIFFFQYKIFKHILFYIYIYIFKKKLIL